MAASAESALPEQLNRAVTPPDDVLEPSLRIRDLSVIRDGRRILDGVSLDVPAGGTLAVVGPTGAGKTTLVDAVPRLLEFAPGTVFIGGRDVHDLPLATLRSMIGYAPQEAFLFSATVAENISFGIPPTLSPAERSARVARAAQAAGLDPDLAVLPDGIETVVGERGNRVVGGPAATCGSGAGHRGESPHFDPG